ncbi:MAG TPA: M23 family metallopeptidase [Sphingomonas sp.]
MRAGLRTVIAGLIGVTLLAWVGLVAAMLASHADLARERGRLQREQAVVARRAARVDAYSRSAAGIARALEDRERLIEALVTSRLGPVDAPAPVSATPAKAAAAPRPISALLPDLDQMHRLDVRQAGFARALAAAFDARSRRVETALRGLGLNPDRMLARAREGQGGPLEPLPGGRGLMTPALRRLADSVARLGVLEDTLMALPSGLPTQAQMVTSSYGVRRDPFTGEAAFHPGIDFIGSYGQPILAAADGRVSFAGQRNGYGNCVEIDHGNGIMTRYGHLSGFVAHVGEAVTRGQAIARMGSTGRSTGTHLHFEVRVDGRAIDPRPFLTVRRDGLGGLTVASRQSTGRIAPHA